MEDIGGQRVSLEKIEAQHEQLRLMFKDLSVLCMNPAQHAELVSYFDQFRTLLLNHFTDEEAFMRQIGYPHLAGHKWHHDTLSEDLNRLALIIRSGEHRLTVQELGMLNDIAIEHTEQTDSDFLNFHRSNATPR